MWLRSFGPYSMKLHRGERFSDVTTQMFRNCLTLFTLHSLSALMHIITTRVFQRTIACRPDDIAQTIQNLTMNASIPYQETGAENTTSNSSTVEIKYYGGKQGPTLPLVPKVVEEVASSSDSREQISQPLEMISSLTPRRRSVRISERLHTPQKTTEQDITNSKVSDIYIYTSNIHTHKSPNSEIGICIMTCFNFSHRQVGVRNAS